MIDDFRDRLAALSANGVRFLVVGAPFRIDLTTSISGVGFDEAWEGRLAGVMFKVPVVFLGRDAFVRNKRASGRPKDLADIRALGE